MSFRTDGFEPSAYTIPPPRPGAHDQPAGDPPAGPIILPQPLVDQSIQCGTRAASIWLKCPRDCRDNQIRDGTKTRVVVAEDEVLIRLDLVEMLTEGL